MPTPRLLLARALAALTPTRRGVIAPALGIHDSALRRYLDGSRGVPRGLLREVAALLRARAGLLTQLAHTLEQEEHDATGGQRSPATGRARQR